MARGLIIGFLAGAILAGVAFKLLQRGGDDRGEATTPGAESGGGKSPNSVSGGGAASDSAQLASARAEAALLREEIVGLKAELAEAKKAAGGGGKAKVNRAAKWKELTALIAQAKKDAEAGGTPIKGDKYFGPLLALIGYVADDLGVPVQEAVLSPDWYPAFAKSMLDSSPFPLSDEQRAALDKVVGDSQAAWDKYVADRENMSPLERARALRDIQFEMFNKLNPIGNADQVAYMSSLNMPPPNVPYQGVNDGAGPREAVKTNISNNMAKSLGLDGNQMATLSPVIDDYMRSYDALAKEAAIRKKAGEKYDDVGAKIALAIETQKRIGETVRLTEAQSKALKEWTQVHDYQIKD